MKPSTTLNAIRACKPCADGWRKLLAHLGKTQADDEPLALLTIIESNGLDDALWVLRAMPEHDRHWRLYAVWCARQVQHLMTDPRSIAALDVAERHANGRASDDELDAARGAAWDAARGDAAGDAAGYAAWPAAGGGAAWPAALAAARAAARGAARGGARGGAAWDAARDAQEREFRRVCAVIAAEQMERTA